MGAGEGRGEGRYSGKKCRLVSMFSLTFAFFLVEIIVGENIRVLSSLFMHSIFHTSQVLFCPLSTK